jgi:hypothetical protein
MHCHHSTVAWRHGYGNPRTELILQSNTQEVRPEWLTGDFRSAPVSSEGTRQFQGTHRPLEPETTMVAYVIPGGEWRMWWTECIWAPTSIYPLFKGTEFIPPWPKIACQEKRIDLLTLLLLVLQRGHHWVIVGRQQRWCHYDMMKPHQQRWRGWDKIYK